MISKKQKIIFIIAIPVIIIFFIIIINLSSSKQYKDECNSDADCPKNERCQFNPDYNKKLCSSGHTCFITPNSSLLECDASDIDNSCNICNNQPAYKCVVVNDNHPYKVNTGYGTFTSLKNSNPGKGWCLPPLQTSITCNPLTSDTILTETFDEEGHVVYNWSCYCKYPQLVTKSINGTDCDVEVACDYQNSGNQLYVPDGSSISCQSDDQCNPTISSDPKICYEESCYKKWIVDKDTDPTTGICKCKSPQHYIGTKTNKYCVKDGCAPNGHSDGDGNCICDNNYIECPGDKIFNESVKNQCSANNHICIPDPCVNGTADKDLGCLCNDGYIRERDYSSPTLYICKKSCIDPNFCEDRGKCTVTGDKKSGTDKEVCEQCKCPWESSDDNRCSNSSGKYVAGTECNTDICREVCCSGQFQKDFGKIGHCI